MGEPWETMSSRVVIVARWGERDGIAKYADEHASVSLPGRSLLRVGILDGPGDYHRDFHNGPRALWLLRDARRSDDVLVHYHPHYYIRGGTLARSLSYLSWAVLGLLRKTTFVVHEFDPEPQSRLERMAQRLAWRRARRLVFPSLWQRDRHLERYGAPPRQRIHVVEHTDLYRVELEESREEARDRLGLPRDRTLLVMLGFISAESPDKGYDRALAAFAKAAPGDAELRIVGSPIRNDAIVNALLERLRSAAAASPNVFLHEGFVDDRDFDRWLRAADALVAPYRSGSSSGVVARARLLGTRVITSGIAGLAEQMGPDDILADTEEALVEACRTVARDAAYARRASSSR